MYYWTTNRYFKVETALLQFLSNLSHSFTGLLCSGSQKPASFPVPLISLRAWMGPKNKAKKSTGNEAVCCCMQYPSFTHIFILLSEHSKSHASHV